MLLPPVIIISEYCIIFQKVDEPQLTCGGWFQFYAIISAGMSNFMHIAFFCIADYFLRTDSQN